MPEARVEPGRGTSSQEGFALSPEQLRWERDFNAQGLAPVAGLDEAGRGPLAGPVVAAAVVLPPLGGCCPVPLLDSKRLTPAVRLEAWKFLSHHPGVAIGVGVVGPEEIDRINILAATREAMVRALDALPLRPAALLIDALQLPSVPLPQHSLIRGEEASLSIAAASIVAKVHRDRLMVELDREYPGFGLARHKGYPTPAHLAALQLHGPSPIHRFSFRPVQRAAERWEILKK